MDNKQQYKGFEHYGQDRRVVCGGCGQTLKDSSGFKHFPKCGDIECIKQFT